MDNSLDLKHIMKVLHRRAATLIGVMVVVTAIVGAVAYFLPPVYSSTATILVESQQIPNELARSTVTTNAVERMQIIQQRLMTRTNLLEIASKFDLFADTTVPMTSSEIVTEVRDSTAITRVKIPGKRQRGEVQALVFTISYENDNPATASRVANEFVTLILEQNIKSRVARASETQEFFEQETTRLKNELSQIETQIAAFKQENAGKLPTDLNYNRELSINLQRQISAITNKINILEEQQRLLTERYAALGGGTLIDGTLSEEQILLNQLRQTLVSRRTKYQDSHPYVKLVLSQISKLEEAMEKQAAEGPAPEVEETADEPQDSQSAAPTNGPDQLILIESQLKLYATQLAALEKRTALLREKIEQSPQVELALNKMNRTHVELQTQYLQVTQKLAAADTGEKLEEGKQAERFEIVEQATPADKPARPARVLIASGGFAASLALSLGLVMLLEYLNQTIRSARDLESWMSIRPFAEIPFIETDKVVRNNSIKGWVKFGAWLGAILLAMILVHTLYKPLDVLITDMADRSGLQTMLDLIKSKF